MMSRVEVTPDLLERAAALGRADQPVLLVSWRDLREAWDRGLLTRDEARRRLGLPPAPASWWRRLGDTIAAIIRSRATTTSRGSAGWTR